MHVHVILTNNWTPCDRTLSFFRLIISDIIQSSSPPNSYQKQKTTFNSDSPEHVQSRNCNTITVLLLSHWLCAQTYRHRNYFTEWIIPTKFVQFPFKNSDTWSSCSGYWCRCSSNVAITHNIILRRQSTFLFVVFVVIGIKPMLTDLWSHFWYGN